MEAVTLDLFAPLECDHLPVSQRVFKGNRLVCGRCGQVLREKTYKEEVA